MGPKYLPSVGKLYECSNCRRRLSDPESLNCDRCGGVLRNITRPRDL